jgi:tRNA dimethylallyltransferase
VKHYPNSNSLVKAYVTPVTAMPLRSKVIVILGPTASGKTGLAVELCRRVSGEVVSVDSRQVYRGLDLGTGKDLSEYGEIPYHLIDIRDPGEPYSVYHFQMDALSSLSDISRRSHVPVLCGGTAYYVKALIDDYPFPSVTSRYSNTVPLERLSRDVLYQYLDRLGLWTHHHWERDSRRRMARAIEVALGCHTSKPPAPKFRDLYQVRIFYTCLPREQLRERIRHRLEKRLKAGMIDEVSAQLGAGLPDIYLRRLGLEYRWVCRFLSNEVDFQTMRSGLETDIARFAKRQMTYLRYLEKCGHNLHPIESSSAFFELAESWLSDVSTVSQSDRRA